jgi:hypothetical protein
MTEVEKLRSDAMRCRRLARTINAVDAVNLLEEMALELERRADEIEAQERQDGKSE